MIWIFRWWKDAHDSVTGDADGKRGLPFLASPGSSYAGPMKIINSIFNSDLLFNLRREEDSSQNNENGEVGISGRDYALVSGEMWVQALKWWVLCHNLFHQVISRILSNWIISDLFVKWSKSDGAGVLTGKFDYIAYLEKRILDCLFNHHNYWFYSASWR